MLRLLTFCALMVLGVESIVNRLRKVNQAAELLDKHLAVMEENRLEKDIIYLQLISAVYYPALEVAFSKVPDKLNVTELYLRDLDKVIPEVEANPNESAQLLKDTVEKTAYVFAPLNKVVDEQCKELSDDLCNALLKKLLASGKRYDLEIAVSALDKANEVTKVFLETNPKLEELTETLNLRSYLLTNPNAEAHILALSDWLKVLMPVRVPLRFF